MKKIFLSKSLMVKIALVLVIILLFEFAVPRPVGAASLGGTLLNPIINLVVYLADGVIQILQSALTTIDESFSYIDITAKKQSFLIKAVMIIGGMIVAAVAIVLIVISAPLSVPALIVVATAGVVVADTGMFFAIYPQVFDQFVGVVFGGSFVYSNIFITPESILKNQIQLFNVNFFDANPVVDQNDNTANLVSTFRTVIAQVYLTIRDIALLAMLIVIIFIAIRLLLALTPKEKSRYKESIMNCLIGIAIILGLHFGMSLMVKGVELITNSIGFSSQIVTDFTGDVTEENVNQYLATHPDVYNSAIQCPMIEIVSKELYEAVSTKDENGNIVPVYEGIILGDNEEIVSVKMSNFTEEARYLLQKLYVIDDDNNTIETWAHIGWAFVYIILVILTVAFVILYAKRTLYMMLLTIFAPIIGVMYPINRVNGSRAHALNLWFKEYMANLVIQPFHLFTYTILIGSVMSFAITNPVYVIIAIAGILFVENLLKDLLGIQDSRIGGLAKAVQDTTRAIKTTEKATTSIARSVGRTVSRGVNAAAGTTAGIIASVNANRNNSGAEEDNTNRQPRVQNNPGAQNPQLAGQNGTNALPGDNRNALGIESNDTRQDIIDTNFVDNENGNVTTMPGRGPIRIGMNDGEVANPDALVAGGNGIDIGTPLQDNVVGSEFLDSTTMDMVNDLNGNGTGFNVIDGGRDIAYGYGDFLASDGERSIYHNDDGIDHMVLEDGTNYQDPMAMAVGGGFVANTIVGSDYNNGTIDVSSSDSDMTTENVLGGVGGDSSLSGTSSSISYTDSTGSQSIPDGNTVRSTVEVEDERSMLKDSFGVWTNPNTPEPSSDERPNLRTVDSGSTSGSSSVNIPTNNTTTTDTNTSRTRTVDTSASTNADPTISMNTSRSSSTSTQNIPRVDQKDVDVLPPENNPVFDVGNNGSRGSRGNGGNAGNGSPSGNAGNAGNTGNSSPSGNSGNTGNGSPTGNGGNGGNGTSNGNSGNAENNNGSSNKQNNMAENILNGVATGLAKGVDTTGKVAKKTASVTGTLVDGIIDSAAAAAGGHPGEMLGTAVGSVAKAVTGMEVTGSGASSATSQEVVVKRAGRPSQNVQYIVKETGMSLDDARAIEAQCKKYRINDDRNMALVGGVYKKVSESDKKEIFKLSSVLYEMKRNGKSEKEAREVLDNQAHVSSTTKDLLMKMYDKLIR